ncbi:MAG: hypothetical protein R6V22_04280 [Rhodohalobacter sp.]|uniref:hypothetical protein n=1 Tax=Rhodohalobacter sp. TaxID=1974210 RepID=UPI003974FF26
MKIDQTTLQIFEFGDTAEDTFYCLVDLRVSPNGMNVEKMRLSDPRNIDLQFRENGCLLMLNGEEIEEIIRRGDANRDNLHKSLYQLASEEGIV